MLPALGRLFARAWANLLNLAGTTTTTIVVFSFLVPILAFLIDLGRKWHLQRKSNATVIKIIRDSVISWTTLVPTCLTLSAWLSLFSWSFATTIYKEHKTLGERANMAEAAAQSAKENAARPVLETSTVRLIDAVVISASGIRPVSMQTDTVNRGKENAYNIVVRQSAVTGVDWRFEWKDVRERHSEILAANQGTLTTTSVAPKFDGQHVSSDQWHIYIYGTVEYEERTSERSKKHGYSYCYYLFSIESKDPIKPELSPYEFSDKGLSSASDVVGKFVECPKQPPAPF